MGEPFQLKKNNGVAYLSYPPWDEKKIVGHGFSTRQGGESRGPFASLNLGTRGGDNPFLVRNNRQKFLAIWEKEIKQLVYGEQIHGIETAAIGKTDAFTEKHEYPGVDALITAEKDVVLGGFCADCLLVFFLEPEIPVIGLAHAGWRGTCGGILEKVVFSMQENYGARPENLQILFSPSIKVGCYEVGDEVLEYFKCTPNKEAVVLQKDKKTSRVFLDIPETNRNVLVRTGVDPFHITSSNYCTHCYPDLFYSFRGAGGTLTGSMMGIIYLT